MGKGFISEKEFTPDKSERPWKKKETDRMLNLYLSGSHPRHIAIKLNRSPKSIRRRLEQLTYNERDRATRYRPRKRISRIGMRISENDQLIIDEHRKRNVPLEATCRVLQRKPNEIRRDWEGEIRAKRPAQVIAPIVDLMLAHRYLYWCAKKPIITNQVWDAMKEEQMEFGQTTELLEPASDKPIHYDPHIKSLAIYLLFKHWISKNPLDDEYERKLPYGAVKEYKEKRKSR